VNRYTVDWWDAADSELLRLWLETPTLRSDITSATHEISKHLSEPGETLGEFVHEGLRSLEVAPLRVLFSIEEKDRLVRVWTVRLIRNDDSCAQ
jgi:hypothetical protein